MPRHNYDPDTNLGRKRLPPLVEGVRCVKVYVPDEITYTALLIGALNKLAQQSTYNRDEAHTAKDVAQLWTVANQMTFETLGEGCGDSEGVNGDEVIEIIRIGGFDDDNICEDCEMSCRLRIEESNGQSFLVEDCGCGVIRRYALQMASVDTDTGAVGSGIDAVPTGTLTPDAGALTDCYYDAATTAIIESCKAYVDSVGGWLLTGVFVASGAPIFIEYAQWLAAVINGDIHVDMFSLGFTPTEIKAAMDGQAFYDEIRLRLENRNLSGQLNRFNVIRLMQWLPPTLDFPTPFTLFCQSWAGYVNLQSLNNELASIAAQCKNNFALPGGNSQIIESGGTEYLLYEFKDLPLVVENDTYLTPVMQGDLLCAYGRIDHTANDTQTVVFELVDPDNTIRNVDVSFGLGSGPVQTIGSMYRNNLNERDILIAASGALPTIIDTNQPTMLTGAQTLQMNAQNVPGAKVITYAELICLRTKP